MILPQQYTYRSKIIKIILFVWTTLNNIVCPAALAAAKSNTEVHEPIKRILLLLDYMCVWLGGKLKHLMVILKFSNSKISSCKEQYLQG